MTTKKFFLEFKVLAVVIISAAMLCGCGGNSEEALNADNAEESASDLITFFDGAKPEIKKLAKAAAKSIIVIHEDLIKKEFWKARPLLLE